VARDLVFQVFNVLGQNELKLTWKRLYLKKIFRGFAPGQPHRRRGGREDEGKGRKGRERRRRKGGKERGVYGGKGSWTGGCVMTLVGWVPLAGSTETASRLYKYSTCEGKLAAKI
jgi:hypothetical protein